MKRGDLTKLTFFIFYILTCILSGSDMNAQGDLDYGIYYGYQGWHLAPGDGRKQKPDEWYHWFDANAGPGDPEELGVDLYPDMSEYTKVYNTNMSLADGTTATLYSAFDYETVDLHIKWMKDYGIKGCFLQRQNANIQDLFQLEFRDTVAVHLRKACEKYGVKFCMMPCNNDKNTGGQAMVDKVIKDWKHCIDDLKITESPMYMHQNGKPVIGFWGLGFDNRPMTPEEANQILDFFQHPEEQKYQVYVMGGVPVSWRTNPKTGWSVVFDRLDMISPWRTIFANPFAQSNITRMSDDFSYCNARGIDYNPVVSPGASTATQHHDISDRNWKKRDGGKFFWQQVYEVCKMGSKFIYGAMFDEVDEGTAMYKMTSTNEECPINTIYGVVPMNEDGYPLPGDWYLQLAREAQKMLDGTIALSPNMPLDPNNPNNPDEPDNPTDSTGITEPNDQIPYATMNIPGTVQAEDYDKGGEGIAYHEVDTTYLGSYRTDQVDVALASDINGYYIEGIEDGEWLEYTMGNVTEGVYDIQFTTACENTGRSITAELDSVSLGTVNVPNTGSVSNWQNVTLSDIRIDSGTNKVFKIIFNGGSLYLDSITFNSSQSSIVELYDRDNNEIIVYPNPADDFIIIEAEDIVSIQVYSINGTSVIEDLSMNKKIDVSHLLSGSYIVKIKLKGNAVARKLISVR